MVSLGTAGDYSQPPWAFLEVPLSALKTFLQLLGSFRTSQGFPGFLMCSHGFSIGFPLGFLGFSRALPSFLWIFLGSLDLSRVSWISELPRASHEFLMGSQRFSWVLKSCSGLLMGFQSFSWIPRASHEFLMGSQSFSRVSHGFPELLMGTQEMLRASHGFLTNFQDAHLCLFVAHFILVLYEFCWEEKYSKHSP